MKFIDRNKKIIRVLIFLLLMFILIPLGIGKIAVFMGLESLFKMNYLYIPLFTLGIFLIFFAYNKKRIFEGFEKLNIKEAVGFSCIALICFLL